MYEIPVTVEFEDIDSYNIAHHTKIIAYLERARVHFFADNGIDLNTLDFGVVLVNLNIRFRKPLLMLDRVKVQLSVKEIEKIRFIWDYKIIKDNKTAVSAEIEQVVINKKTKQIIPIPDQMIKLLKSIMK